MPVPVAAIRELFRNFRRFCIGQLICITILKTDKFNYSRTKVKKIFVMRQIGNKKTNLIVEAHFYLFTLTNLWLSGSSTFYLLSCKSLSSYPCPPVAPNREMFFLTFKIEKSSLERLLIEILNQLEVKNKFNILKDIKSLKDFDEQNNSLLTDRGY